MTGSAKATVFIDNERVIVTEYRFAPGDNTGWHRHGHDYVIVPLTDAVIACCAQRVGATVLTFDHHFQMIDNLQVTDHLER